MIAIIFCLSLTSHLINTAHCAISQNAYGVQRRINQNLVKTYYKTINYDYLFDSENHRNLSFLGKREIHWLILR